MAVSIKTVAAVFFTVVSIGAVRAAHLTATQRQKYRQTEDQGSSFHGKSLQRAI